MTKSTGFTLVEMLITMSILSMVVLAGSSAFGFFAQQWDGHLGKFDQSMSSSRNIMLVQEVLDNLMPYMAYDSKDQPSVMKSSTCRLLVRLTVRTYHENR